VIVSYFSPDGGDGARIYDISGFDESPPRPRLPRLAVHLRAIPLAAWPFLIVAGALLVWRMQSAWSSGYASQIDWATMTSIGVAALMPAALLIGCPKAWRTAPAVFAGVVAWVWVAAALELAIEIWMRIGPQELPDVVDYWLEAAGELAVIPALAGPMLIAYGLSSRRRTATTWPRPITVAAVVLAAAWGLIAAKGTIDFFTSTNLGVGAGAGLTNRQIVYAITSFLRPLEMLGLGAIAWSSLSAIRAGEPQRRFWVPALVGSTVLFLLACYSGFWQMAFYSGSVPNDLAIAVYSTLSGIASAAYLFGYAVLVFAFGLGLPPDPLDLGEVVAAGDAEGAENASVAPGSFPPIG
jgi:hypothetical protein